MTTQTRNAAAERLRNHLGNGLTDSAFRSLIDEALDTERKGTVKRIREAVVQRKGHLQRAGFLAILDEEAEGQEKAAR